MNFSFLALNQYSSILDAHFDNQVVIMWSKSWKPEKFLPLGIVTMLVRVFTVFFESIVLTGDHYFSKSIKIKI